MLFHWGCYHKELLGYVIELEYDVYLLGEAIAWAEELRCHILVLVLAHLILALAAL